MIFPCAVATISIHPIVAQKSPAINTPMIVQLIARPMGEGGACSISSTAGRNSVVRPRGVVPSCRVDSARQAAFQIVQCLESAPKAIMVFTLLAVPLRYSAACTSVHKNRWHAAVLHANLLRRFPLFQPRKCDSRAGRY